jgi:hypothetical protein
LIDVETEPDFWSRGDLRGEVAATEFAEQLLPFWFDTRLEREIEGEHYDIGIQERDASLDRVLHRVLVLSIQQVRKVGPQIHRERRLQAPATSRVTPVRPVRPPGERTHVGELVVRIPDQHGTAALCVTVDGSSNALEPA